jgi:AraC family transcriptional regulator of adaptative response/methylated-DNA-[protein]-cysteine methyltransferase
MRRTGTPAQTNGADAAHAAAAFLENHGDEDITLERLAAEAGMSPAHLQRTFTKVFGHSPKQHQSALRAEALKARLKGGEAVSDAGYGAGFGSSRGVYEASQRRLGMAPGSYRRGGAGMRIRYATAPTPMGPVLVGVTEAGVCAVMLGDSLEHLEAALAAEFPRAARECDDEAAEAQARAVADYIAGSSAMPDVPLDISGTDFQRTVWTALRRVPSGHTVTYSEIAREIGSPTAYRAVANACGDNHIAVLVPCHRVVRSDGGMGGYKWGLERKHRLLECESAADGERCR